MYRQLTLKLSNCPVVSWANQSIGALKERFSVYYDSNSDSDSSVGDKNCHHGRIIIGTYETHKPLRYTT
jgi:hypothetical protein